MAAKPGAIPYRLFALSNLGSLLALFSFPLVVEPLAATHTQAYGWSGDIRLVRGSLRGARVGRAESRRSERNRPQPAHAPAGNCTALWIALAACGSALLLSVTTHLSTNVAPIPLLWVATLGIYLLSFIICFERERFYHRAVFLPLLGAALGAAAYALYYNKGNLTIKWSIPAFLAALFICCMACHGELVAAQARSKTFDQFLFNGRVGRRPGRTVRGGWRASLVRYLHGAADVAGGLRSAGGYRVVDRAGELAAQVGAAHGTHRDDRLHGRARSLHRLSEASG